MLEWLDFCPARTILRNLDVQHCDFPLGNDADANRRIPAW